jgi:alkylation response protein AidB-like acyl-CoA dehydrogenase
MRVATEKESSIMSKDNKKAPRPGDDTNLAEEVLRQGGKTEEEAGAIGTIDRAEDEFERTLDPKFRTENSPVARAIFGKTDVSLFARQNAVTTQEVKAYAAAMDACVAIVKGHREANTLFDANNKVSDQVIAELFTAGYWKMLIPTEYGGFNTPVADFMAFLTRMAAEGDATVAGMNSIHECIGAVDPLVGYGNDDQKSRYLPRLGSDRLSAFALTEPGAGSDLTAVRTTAVLDGDDYVVNGEKLFISNVRPGRIIGLVVKIDGKHAVLIAELPDAENEHFQLVEYGIHAVTHIYNRGIKFNNFRVPKANLLDGKGLLIAYHGLNRGRVALCANAAGVMRQLLQSMLPWAAFRKTYGQPIEKRELVMRRIAEVAGRIVAADALREWCSSLLDEGYRGELECIIAKIYGADSLTKTAMLALKTHGGRSFLKGHIVGDNLHDFFAPSIYEGENEMLAMAFFKGLSKDPGNRYMGPLMSVMSGAGVDMKKMAKPGVAMLKESLKLLKPKNLIKLIKAGLPMAGWILRSELRGKASANGHNIDGRLNKHANFALKVLSKQAKTIMRSMLGYQVKLADEQDLMVDELSMVAQKAVTILVTCLHASEKGDDATIAAADVVCRDITRELTGGKKDLGYRRASRKLAKLVVEGKFTQLGTTMDTAILRPYTS